MDNFQFSIIQEQTGCCTPDITLQSENTVPGLNQSFVEGSIDTPAGTVPKVSSRLVRADYWGSVKARWGIGRMNFKVDPGLYALGQPDDHSPVFVTANYKMSFDRLRRSLAGRNGWILVLDTKGINVWCAAGKGTFGTAELVKRIISSGLKKIVGHRNIILPQLGAPGVSAHNVRKISGFNVQYGPVRAEDLPAYLDAGCFATPAMRRVTFPWKDRVVLIPMEFLAAMKPFLMISILLFFVAGIVGPAGFWDNARNSGGFAVLALFCAVIGGSVLHPLLLPYLPGRAFSIKGFSIGVVVTLVLLYLRNMNLSAWPGRMEALAWFLLIPSVSGYLAMNFTGSSTYTSLSGVKKEMRRALPLEITCCVLGIMMWLGSLLMA